MSIIAKETVKKMEHTPTPWNLYGDYIIKDNKNRNLITLSNKLGYDENKVNGEFIVRAVNNHEKLLEIAKASLEYLSHYGPVETYKEVEQAIAKATA